MASCFPSSKIKAELATKSDPPPRWALGDNAHRARAVLSVETIDEEGAAMGGVPSPAPS